ncbi:cellulose biosynthesis protein BcsQ [Gallaecimonas sp. GXIMD1310]|uniref:cellulose biosynthesis protein BcsQ n=1 Tax=Gallaecimonas sp. GXIMD1310 TaxID=3131926 RepID=UPI003244FF67
MNLVYFSSPKGGVGKSTLVANLAFALQRLGHQVVVVDFDSQNAQRLHLGLPMSEQRGLVAQLQSTDDWRNLILETPSGIGLLPYGNANRAQREHFNAQLQQRPDCIALGLGPLLSQPGCIVLADLPTGPGEALYTLREMEAIPVVVMEADSTSAATLGQVSSDNFLADAKALYIVNQVYIRSRLNRDSTELFEKKLGAALLGTVHRDEAVREAIASQKSIFEYAPASAVVQDLEAIARNISRMLPEAYGHSAMKLSFN